jgi:hypothetical protein
MGITAISGDGTWLALAEMGTDPAMLTAYHLPELSTPVWTTRIEPVSELSYDKTGDLLLAPSMASETISQKGAQHVLLVSEIRVFDDAGALVLNREAVGDATWVANLSRNGGAVLIRPASSAGTTMTAVVAVLEGRARVGTTTVDAQQTVISDNGSLLGLYSDRLDTLSTLPLRDLNLQPEER